MQEYVLSGEEIVRLKQYIDQKHQGLHPQQRASILADAVHRSIEVRLPSFPAMVKKQIRSELLMNNRESLNIEVDDVLQQCMSLDLNREDLLLPLTAWACSKSSIPIQEEAVRQTLLKWSQQPMPTVGIQALEMDLDLDPIDSSSQLELAATCESVVSSQVKGWINRRIYIAGAVFTGVIILLILIIAQQSSAPVSDILQPPIIQVAEPLPTGGVPMELRYVPVDTKRLQKYLRGKNSILAEEPYMSAIIKASKQYNIHPLLLFAITGQEQGFVPKNHKEVEEIANNPFNVFGSWESYNTTIESSAAIAAKTVSNISNRRPIDSHPIQWLNKTYAEDPNWWKGVTWFFNQMLQEIKDDSFDWPE